MSILFDERGMLVPAGLIPVSIAKFEELFVNAFPDSETRRVIFQSYQEFTKQFSEQICSKVTHWIDGSFVTDKLNPNDMDVVLIIDDAVYSSKQFVIDRDFRRTGARSLFPGLDIYTARAYPATSQKQFITEYDLAYWYNWFTQTRPNRFGKRFKKGFVQLVYN